MAENDDALNEAGYSERDIREILTSEWFLAVVDAYSQDRFTIGLARSLIDEKSDPQVRRIQERIKSPWSFSHLFHQVARRIRAGTIVVPQDLEERFAEIYQATPPKLFSLLYLIYQRDLYVFKFSDFESMSRDDNPLMVWRDLFTEEDIAEVVKDRRALACIDAMAKGRVGCGTVRIRMVGPGATHTPQGLSIIGLTNLIFEIYHRIKAGTIQVSADLPTEFPFAYERKAPGE